MTFLNRSLYELQREEDFHQELFPGYPQALLRIAALCCIMFMFIGIPGNLITIIALFKYKKVRNATALFIMNLSTSDLMFCCFNLPFAASLFWQRAWTHSRLLCRLLPLMRYGLLAVSLFSILSITINRYVMIGHPRLYPKIYKPKHLACMLAFMWLSGFGALIATWLGKWGAFGLDVQIGSCSIIPDENGHSPKQFLFVLAFVIPCFFILVCYARIFYIVRKTALKSRMAPRNNVVLTNNSSSTTQKDDSKSQQFKGDFQSPEDSALGTLSTGATLTDKSSLNADKIHYINEGTSYLLTDDPSIGNNDSSGIEKSPVHTKKQFSDDEYDVKNGEVLNNNGINGKLKVRSNPNLLTLPEQKYGKVKNKSINDRKLSTRSYSEENLDIVPKLKTEKELNKSIKKNGSQLDKSFSLDQITDNDQKVNNKIPANEEGTRKQRRCSSLAIVNVGNIFRRQSHFTPNNNEKFRHKSSLRHTPSTHNTPGKMTAKDKKILKMIVVILLSFITCYLPITISKMYTMDSYLFNIMGYILIYLTPCINPLIYVVMSSEYRQAYKNLLMCKSYGLEGSGRST
ncbi:G-protein coupled receptor moody-like [Chrysoperla carnea]|uniref:G-protein coupled receptor moody-like n=1 Tax=Chrysoperla carnea TaxID=189513 RepID=UPI001D073101|nr:G-protein coupled receptor moody-like [Chrysoperla carnea]